MVHVRGQIAAWPGDGATAVVGDTIEAQSAQAPRDVDSAAHRPGDFKGMNQAHADVIRSPRPARSIVQPGVGDTRRAGPDRRHRHAIALAG